MFHEHTDRTNDMDRKENATVRYDTLEVENGLYSLQRIDSLFQIASVTNVLKAMGAMPSGFRQPTLGNMITKGM